MAISTQVRLLRAVRDFLSGEGGKGFAGGSAPKPVYQVSQESVPLPRSTPEAQGIASRELEKLYRELSGIKSAGAHSLLVARNGHVISEGYFAPYRKGVWHVSHSLSKTFTGTAVGLAIHEGYFTLDDRVADFFPKESGGRILPKRMRSITVRHLLTMSSGANFNEVNEAVETEWVRGFFAAGNSFEPGTRFVYNSMNTYMLSALVQTTTGHTVSEFLRPRVFEPMGFGPIAFEVSPEGIEKGGWGMYITLEDMAKFGQLYLQKGRWNVDGAQQQLVPEEWIREATAPQIRGETGEAYGYQIVVDGDSGNYIMNGMFGQFVWVVPTRGIVVAMNAGNPQMFTDSAAHTLLRRHFYASKLAEGPLPDAPVDYAALTRALARLQFGKPLAPEGQRLPKRMPARTAKERWNNLRREVQPAQNAEAFCGTVWGFADNNAGILPMILQVMDGNFSAGLKALHLQNEQGQLVLYWEEGENTFYLPLGFGRAAEKHITIGKERFLVACLAQLTKNEDDEDVLKIDVFFLEHSSSRHIKLLVRDGRLHLYMDENPGLLVAITGVLEQTIASGGTLEKRGAGMINDAAATNARIRQICMPHLEGEPLYLWS